MGGNRAAMLRAMPRNPKVTARQLAPELGIRDTAVENILRYFQARNFIARLGPAKGGAWKVQAPKA